MSTEIDKIQNRLIHLRGCPVILDSDLAALYGVTTSALNQAVTRNAARFPEDFSFIPDRKEVTNLISQIVTSSSAYGGRRNPPRVFTEHGALMASTILRSDRAVAMSLYVIRAFVKMREDMAANQAILKRLAEIDKGLLLHDSALRDIYQKLMPLLAPPPEPARPRIGFHSQDK